MKAGRLQVRRKNNYDFPAFITDGEKVLAYCPTVEAAQLLADAYNREQQNDAPKVGGGNG